MLPNVTLPRLSEFDQSAYGEVVRPDHFLRKVLEVIPWDDFNDLLAPYYSSDMGRPAESPVLMLKLEYLRYQHNLSDREVIARAETDLAFRYFLQVPLRWKLPNFSSLCVFRGRLGRKGFREVFDRIVHIAREHGVVKDRLRIKDATHVIADIAVPSALALVAQTRDKLLAVAEPFAPLIVEGERVNLEMLRESTRNHSAPDRLAARVAQLREMLIWADTVIPPEDAATNRAWEMFLTQRDLAHKIVNDQSDPDAHDRTVSITDPDARRGKHGSWYEGYLVDVLVDADSEMITVVNVLPASGEEAVDALELIRQEETAHGNDIQAISIDGAGYNGPVLRELEAPDGLNVRAYVPPPSESKSELFTARDFQEDTVQGMVTCPAGQTTKHHYYEKKEHATTYQFAASVCRTCPLLSRCMKKAPGRRGRIVRKSDYQVEHERVRQKATTPEYAAVRREHPKVERKLGEIMNRHGGRRARYRGRWKVLIQELMASLTTNVKRLVGLDCAHATAVACPK